MSALSDTLESIGVFENLLRFVTFLDWEQIISSMIGLSRINIDFGVHAINKIENIRKVF